ncbi:MAG: chaperone modulator CbpM [Proteobacteria bacterium]|nr:chaperone modulator CbpM [Pseudomonadota bacterium]MBU1060127.1 chaperone modulator CbpM [Pseudomonadota bacterium]
MKTDIQYTVFDETSAYCLKDLCRLCRVHAQFIHDLIDEGILSPQGTDPRDWRFGAVEIKRIEISVRLQKDLHINLAGAALALDLLEEIEELRSSRSLLEQFHSLEKRD